MVKLTFYEKPGCINNRRQRHLLEAQGCTLEGRNLLSEIWNRQLLAHFFTHHREITQWFNKNSPRIKSGEIKPHLLSADDALGVMVDDPLLIRRPLIACYRGNKIFRSSGFDYAHLNSSLNLNLDIPSDSNALVGEDIETCPRSNKSTSATNSMVAYYASA